MKKKRFSLSQVTFFTINNTIVDLKCLLKAFMRNLLKIKYTKQSHYIYRFFLSARLFFFLFCTECGMGKICYLNNCRRVKGTKWFDLEWCSNGTICDRIWIYTLNMASISMKDLENMFQEGHQSIVISREGIFPLQRTISRAKYLKEWKCIEDLWIFWNFIKNIKFKISEKYKNKPFWRKHVR